MAHSVLGIGRQGLWIVIRVIRYLTDVPFSDYLSYKFQTFQSAVQPGSLESEAGILASAFDLSGSRLITVEVDKSIKVWKEDESAVITICYSPMPWLLWLMINPFFFNFRHLRHIQLDPTGSLSSNKTRNGSYKTLIPSVIINNKYYNMVDAL